MMANFFFFFQINFQKFKQNLISICTVKPFAFLNKIIISSIFTTKPTFQALAKTQDVIFCKKLFGKYIFLSLPMWHHCFFGN